VSPAPARAARPLIALEAGTRVIADLHLDLSGGEGARHFLRWLAGLGGVPHLVVLGDLFDVWVGPAQERMPQGPVVLDALLELVARGTALSVVHGNRDFLLDASFERRTGARVLRDGFVGIAPEGRRILCIHGDELCTQDRGYQRLKKVVRSRPVTALAPRLPLALGAWVARRLRRASVQAVAEKLPAERSMQVAACRSLAGLHAADAVVCGHAHGFRDVRIESGARWIVLDAFGGEHDLLVVEPDGSLRVARSR